MLVVDEAGMADTRTLAPLLEEAALAVAERGQGAWAAGTSDKLALQTATEDGVSLSEEQARMVRGVCTSRDRVVCVVGLAGRGRRPRPVRQGKLLANPASRADLPPAHDVRCRSSLRWTMRSARSLDGQWSEEATDRMTSSSQPFAGRHCTNRTSIAVYGTARSITRDLVVPATGSTTCAMLVSRALVAAGADVKLVQAVAGHSNPLITLKRYSHLLDARVSEAALRFDPARLP